MVISPDNGYWKKNTWGYVRKEGKKFHDGLDLVGISGQTIVYSMYSGIVTRVVHCQPNRIGDDIYPSGYTGDTDEAGNRITIRTTLSDGRVIYVSYWHLDIASKNPYTQKFKVGDKVNAGQKIGVVGNTENARNKMSHLHLKTQIGNTPNSDPVNNPFDYIFTKFDTSTGVVIRDC